MSAYFLCVDFLQVEDECPLKGEASVYCDDTGAYTATLNQASRLEAQTKFYIMQLLETKDGNYHFWTRWGRVGFSGISKVMNSLLIDKIFKIVMIFFADVGAI